MFNDDPGLVAKELYASIFLGWLQYSKCVCVCVCVTWLEITTVNDKKGA